MSITTTPSIGFTLTCPDNATLVPVDEPVFGANAVAPPANCHSIIVYNLDANNRIFVRFGTPGLITAGNTTIANSTVIPVLGSMTFGIGHVVEREYLGETTGMNLYFLPESGNNVAINITYVMGKGRQ